MKTIEVHLAGTLPSVPEPAGTPGMPVATGARKPGVHRCRDCGAALTEPGPLLCARCREAAQARRREQKRLYQQAQHADRKTVRFKKEKPESGFRACGTEGCGGNVSGRAIYCDACRRGRQEAARRKYRISHYVDPLPFGPPTSMDWLKKFDAWAKSGQSYASFQVREREKRASRKRAAPAR